MLYFDSSLIVSLLSSEVRTESLQLWFSKLDGSELYISAWNITEFQSAMSFKRRTGQITAEQRQRAEAVFHQYVNITSSSWRSHLPISIMLPRLPAGMISISVLPMHSTWRSSRHGTRRYAHWTRRCIRQPAF